MLAQKDRERTSPLNTSTMAGRSRKSSAIAASEAAVRMSMAARAARVATTPRGWFVSAPGSSAAKDAASPCAAYRATSPRASALSSVSVLLLPLLLLLLLLTPLRSASALLLLLLLRKGLLGSASSVSNRADVELMLLQLLALLLVGESAHMLF